MLCSFCLLVFLASAQAATCTDGRRLGFNLTAGCRRSVKGGDLPNSFMLLKVVMEKMKALSGSRISMAHNGGLVVKAGFHFGSDIPDDTLVGLGASSSHGLEASLSPASMNTELIEMWRDTRPMNTSGGTWAMYLAVGCDFHVDFESPSDSRFIVHKLHEYMRKNTKGFSHRRWSDASDSDGPPGSDRESPLVVFKDLGSATFCSCLESLNIHTCVTILEFFLKPETIQMLVQDRITVTCSIINKLFLRGLQEA